MGEQLGEWLGELCAGDISMVDEKTLEEDLVVQPPDLPASEFVGLLAVRGEVKRLMQHLLDRMPVGRGHVKPTLRLKDFAMEAVLLFLEEVKRDCFGIVRMQQFALLVSEGG